MIISNGKFRSNYLKENVKNNYSIETLLSKEKWVHSSNFYSVFNKVLNDGVLCMKEDNDKMQGNLDGLRNSSVKLARIICEQFNDLFHQLHSMEKLTNNSGFIDKLMSIQNVIGVDLSSMKNIFFNLSGVNLELENHEMQNPQGFCFAIIKVLDKVGELIKNILRLNKLIEVRFINKELDSMVNNLFSISHALMQMQIMCFK